MTINLNTLKETMARYKVYDAWQYVESLRETLGYMSVSYSLLCKVHDHRVNSLAEMQRRILNEAFETGSASCKESDLRCTQLEIAGYKIDDALFMQKTAMEFFHYGRVSMDVLFQIVNAALFGDEAVEIEDKGLLKKILKKLGSKQEFSALLNLMDTNKNDLRFQYLMSIDNYLKHIKTILITIKNSIIFGNDDVFQLNAFNYGGITYPAENALSKIREIHNYVLDTVDSILCEVLTQIPNCVSNEQRIHELHYKIVFSEKDGKQKPEYISFFIDVPNGVSDLSAEIKVYPLIIKPNNEIYSCDFRFDKIFIRKAGSDESDIVGMATLKSSTNTNEFYKTFEVRPCSTIDYALYVTNFKANHPSTSIKMNRYAMDGVMIFLKDDKGKPTATSESEIE